MSTDLQELFLSLEEKYTDNIQAFFEWYGNSDNPALADYDTHQGISINNHIAFMQYYNGDYETDINELFVGIRGIIVILDYNVIYNSRELSFSLDPLSIIDYDITENQAFTVLRIRMSQGYISVYNRAIKEIADFIDKRNAFIQKMINADCERKGQIARREREKQEEIAKLAKQERERQKQIVRNKSISAFNNARELYYSCLEQTAILDAVANYLDAFPNSPFSDPSDYSSYFYSTMNEFYFTYYRLMRLRIRMIYMKASNISSLNHFCEMTDSFCRFLETDHAIPKWCSHTIAFALMRREVLSRFRKQIESETGISYDGSEAQVFTTRCLENEVILPDDNDAIIPLAWCTTKDDIFDASETDQFLDNLKVVRDTMEAFTKERKRLAFNEMLRKPRNGSGNALSNPKYTIDDIDLMTGAEFEDLVAKIFSKLGFHVTITKTSGDQGIDVLAEKGVQRIGIQAKCYGSSVGNSAIQEAVAGKAFYNLTKVMVITNNIFTPSAVALALANNVVLWDRTILTDKLALF